MFSLFCYRWPELGPRTRTLISIVFNNQVIVVLFTQLTSTIFLLSEFKVQNAAANQPYCSNYIIHIFQDVVKTEQ